MSAYSYFVVKSRYSGIYNKKKEGLMPAFIGDTSGRIEAESGVVFCRMIDGEIIKAVNKIAPLIYDLPVMVVRVDSFWEVKTLRDSYATPAPSSEYVQDELAAVKSIFEKLARLRVVCLYCGSEWTQDARGNCGACGAPKHSKQ